MLRRKSIINQWGRSYALILLIPLITIFINYNYNAKIIRKEIMQAHELILNNLKDSIDRLMEEEREMYSNFYLNEKFRNLVYSQERDSEFYFDAYKFKMELTAYGSSNKNVSYWLYMEDKDYIICSESGAESYKIYNSQKLLSSKVPEYDEWKELLCKNYTNEFFFYDGLYSKGSGKNLVYANSYSYYGGLNANIFITISTSVLEELVTLLPEGAFLTVYLDYESENLERQFLVIDSGGITEPPLGININDIKKCEGTFEGADYMGISVFSGNGKATYSLLVPQETFWKESRNIRNVHLVSLLITLVVGCLLAAFLLKRNFNPVSSLLAIIGNDNREANEFEQIEKAYSMMRKENVSMKNAIESQEKSMVSSYLLSLLKGRTTKVGDREQQVGLGLSFQNKVFVLTGFCVPKQTDVSIEYDDLSFFIVDNIWVELMEGEIFYRIEDGRFLYYLFCIPSGYEEEWKQKCLKNANFLCDFLVEKFDLQLLAAISAVEKDISQAKYMYQSVMEAFEYKNIIGGRGVITSEELCEPDENNQLHVCHVMLEQALENGKMNEAYLASRQLFRDTEHMPFIALRLRALEAFQIVAGSYNKYITDSVKRMQLLAWLEQLLNAENPEDMKQQFEGMLSFVFAKISGQWEAESKGIVKSVMEYVESNYTDSNLNINSIAEKMNKNPKYVSKVFKEETGEGILDYINALRIRRAQEILLTRSISVEELSTMVGYASTRTFRRSFTKIVGMTPSGYLESN